MVCDLLENALGFRLVATFPVGLDAVAWLTAGVTALKWLSLALAHVVLLSALSAAARNAVANRR